MQSTCTLKYPSTPAANAWKWWIKRKEPLHRQSKMIASDLEGSIFSGIDSTWLSRLAEIESNFEEKLSRLAGIDSKWLSRLARRSVTIIICHCAKFQFFF
jgi:hypothetical protein